MEKSKKEPLSPYVTFMENPKQLEVIDQRKLPLTETRIRLRTVDDVKHAIQHMVVRGAPLIGICGAFGMALAGESNEDLDATKRILDASRPTAVNLAHATSRMVSFARRSKENRMNMFDEVKAIAFEEFAASEQMAGYGSSLIPSQPREGHNNVFVIHHCNTGGLATFGSGTALACIIGRYKQNQNLFVWVDETRPRLQGAKLTAWELNRAHIPNNVIADGAAGSLLATGKVDCVMFGADRIVANGDVVNKIGTYPLAVVARENGVPVYCVAPTSTIDLTLPNGYAVKIEERDDAELFEIDGKRFVDESTKGYNPAFDVTPFRYITAIVTEEMICYPPFRDSLALAKARAIARQQKLTVEEVQAVVAHPEKAQELLEKSVPQKRSNTNDRLFPAQNDPVEEKRLFRREDPRPAKPRTYLGDGSSEPRMEHTREEPRFPAPKSSMLTDEAQVNQPISSTQQFEARRGNKLVLGDEAEAPQVPKSSVKVLGNRNKSAGLFAEEEITLSTGRFTGKGRQDSSSTSSMPPSPVKPQEGLSIDTSSMMSPAVSAIKPAGIDDHSDVPTSKGHFDVPKRDEDEKSTAKGHFAGPSSPDKAVHSQTRGHFAQPHLASNIFG